METNEILTKAYELADVIVHSDLYKSYKKYQQILKENEDVNQLLIIFHKEKERFEEASKYGKYHPDYEKIKNEYQLAKVNLMNNENFKMFKQLERQLETVVFEVEKQLRTLVGVKDKHNKSSLKFLY
jgi:cell fate (sporulation/competence/biofilm development) regulator YlbF (YheA/YmcA/DUF963 family)